MITQIDTKKDSQRFTQTIDSHKHSHKPHTYIDINKNKTNLEEHEYVLCRQIQTLDTHIFIQTWILIVIDTKTWIKNNI